MVTIEDAQMVEAVVEPDDNDYEGYVEYVPGKCLELVGQISVCKKKRSKGVWRGPIEDVELALDAAMDALMGLYDEITSVATKPLDAARSEVSKEAACEVTVTRPSGESLSFAFDQESTTSEVKSRVASELRTWPCEVVLMKDDRIVKDDEILSSVGKVFSLVSRNVMAEAKAIVEELACSIRLMKIKMKGVPQVPAARRLFEFAAGPLLKAVLVDRDFGMWAARVLDGLSWEDLSELGFYDSALDNSRPPLMLLGLALGASDGGVAAAAIFVRLCDGERWCAHTVGQALQGTKDPGPAFGKPGEGSALAHAFREAIREGSEMVARDILAACVGIAEVDSNCAAPVVLAGIAPAAAFAWKERVEPEVRTLAGGLLTSLLDSLWPGRGNELKGNKKATRVLIEAMIESGLTEPPAQDTCDTTPVLASAEFLTVGAIFERLGHDARSACIQDLFLDYEYKTDSPNRPLAWLECIQ